MSRCPSAPASTAGQGGGNAPWVLTALPAVWRVGRCKKKASHLAGLRVLVVEDEALIWLLVEDFLKGFGCKIVGVAGSTTEALGLIQAEAIDVAVIDLKLEGEMAYPLADALKAADVPFVFATGVLADEIDGRYAHVPVIGKPFEEGELRRALLEAIDGRERRRQA